MSNQPLSFNTWPQFSPEEIQSVSAILSSGKVNYWTGEHGHLFEQEYAKSVGTPYAVCLMNGTVALEAALFALKIGPNDEVITTSRTFIASASAIIMRGAKPVFADVDENSQNITATSIEKVISARTKAIIVVHLAGWPCEMREILDLAKKHHLFVIEDCAQSHGAMYHQQQVGSMGDIAAFSFCQDKIITTGGEGGMITTHHEDLYKKIWSFKDHGKDYNKALAPKKGFQFQWLHESFGTNWRMTEMQAAIGRIQLKKLPSWRAVRQRNAAILSAHLQGLSSIRVPHPPAHINHAFYKYYIFVKPEYLKPNWSRDRILESLIQQHIPAFAGSCSEIYRENAFINLQLQPQIRLPIAQRLGETSLLFLVHPSLSQAEMEMMGKKIALVLREATLC